MEEYFSQEIKRIKREITMLKTASQKSAGVIPTIAQTLSVSIPLKLESLDLSAEGEAYYIIYPSDNALITCTLDKYSDDPTKDNDFPRTQRSFDLLQNKLDDTNYVLYIYGHGDANDRSTLAGGGSVTLTTNLTIRSTAPFTVEAI